MNRFDHYQLLFYLLTIIQISNQLLINSVPTTYQLYNDDLLLNAWYKRISPTVAGPDGAISVNEQWEKKNSTDWFIELQRYGCDDITAAIYANRSNLLANGQKIFDWGFSQQTVDGGFNGCSNCTPPIKSTGDPFHSVSLFVEAVARCLILMRQSPNSVTYQSYFNQTVPKLIRAVNWLLEPAVLAKGIANDMPYTHRRYILASVLGQTALLTSNASLQQRFYSYAATFAENGLARQNSTGFNPEKDGYDSSYNAVGLYHACNYFVVCPNATLQQRLTQMLSKSFAWQMTRMYANGSANLNGNTRVTGDNKTDEKGRGGTFKNYDYKLTVDAFELSSVLLQNQTLHDEAHLVAIYAGYLPKLLWNRIKYFFT